MWGEKHLLSEELLAEMLVQILQQEKQLHLGVSARQTLASFLRDVGKTVAQDFSHKAAVF